MSWLDEIRFDEGGLVPVIAQEASTGELLMLAYANREALEATLQSNQAHYWSRSRGALWKKGETSGNIQEIVEVRVDCDADALLYRVRQTGPACHTLERSCFHRLADGDELTRSQSPGHILTAVERVVDERADELPEGSYTTYLFTEGVDKILKKVGEEATEVVIAAKNEDAAQLRAEAADLIFHLVVLLRARNLPLNEVWKELEGRFGKASRIPSPHRDRNPSS